MPNAKENQKLKVMNGECFVLPRFNGQKGQFFCANKKIKKKTQIFKWHDKTANQLIISFPSSRQKGGPTNVLWIMQKHKFKLAFLENVEKN